MDLARNKKGQVFTLIAIALLLLFFVSYEIYSILYERQTIKTRIKTMESFLLSIQKDLERQLYISGFRIIFSAEDHITKTGNYISNFSELFDEAILNGTIYGDASEILQGTTITEIQEKIQEKADKMNLIINLSDIKVSVSQEDPWNVVVYFNATLELKDKSGLARWYKKENIKSYISVEGFEDPVYIVETRGKVSRKINKTPYEGNYVSDSDTTNFSLHLQSKYYTFNPLAPSFIYRLEGKKEASEYGIESFVYIPELSAQGLPVYEKSCIDYIYFSSSNPTSYKIQGMPDWFFLDNEHLEKYQVDKLTL